VSSVKSVVPIPLSAQTARRLACQRLAGPHASADASGVMEVARHLPAELRNTLTKNHLMVVGLMVAGLWLAGCQTVDMPELYTLAPSLTPLDRTQIAQTQGVARQTAFTPLPADTVTATPSETPLPTFTRVLPTLTPLLDSTFTPVPPTNTPLPPPTFTLLPPTPTPAPSLTPTFISGNLIANPSFEEGWTVSPLSQQMPNGWQFYSPAPGVTLPFPTKMQEGKIVAALADDYAESQLFLAESLPPDERLGQSRALILDGNTVLRTHGAWRASAVVLRQTLSAPPGALVHATGYILAESLRPNAQGKVEDDDLVAALRLYGAAGLVEDKRLLVVMQTHNDVPNSSRHWNRFEVVAPVPGSGQLLLEVVLQQNWGLESEWFFIDNFSAVVRP